jgi:hypothetical protein
MPTILPGSGSEACHCDIERGRVVGHACLSLKCRRRAFARIPLLKFGDRGDRLPDGIIQFTVDTNRRGLGHERGRDPRRRWGRIDTDSRDAHGDDNNRCSHEDVNLAEPRRTEDNLAEL